MVFDDFSLNGVQFFIKVVIYLFTCVFGFLFHVFLDALDVLQLVLNLLSDEFRDVGSLVTSFISLFRQLLYFFISELPLLIIQLRRIEQRGLTPFTLIQAIDGRELFQKLRNLS